MTFGKIIAVFVSLTIAATSAATAQTVTAYKTGESRMGLTKQCYYESLGDRHTQTIESTELCPLSIMVRSVTTRAPLTQPTMTRAFNTGERTTGLTKLCFYNGLSNERTKAIKSVGFCPFSIWVRPQH